MCLHVLPCGRVAVSSQGSDVDTCAIECRKGKKAYLSIGSRMECHIVAKYWFTGTYISFWRILTLLHVDAGHRLLRLKRDATQSLPKFCTAKWKNEVHGMWLFHLYVTAHFSELDLDRVKNFVDLLHMSCVCEELGRKSRWVESSVSSDIALSALQLIDELLLFLQPDLSMQMIVTAEWLHHNSPIFLRSHWRNKTIIAFFNRT